MPANVRGEIEMIQLQNRARMPPGAHANNLALPCPDHILISPLCRKLVGDITCGKRAPHDGNSTHHIANTLAHKRCDRIAILRTCRPN